MTDVAEWNDGWAIRRAVALPTIGAVLPLLRLLEPSGSAWWLALAYAILLMLALGVWLLGDRVFSSARRRRQPLRTRLIRDWWPWPILVPTLAFAAGLAVNLVVAP